MSRFHRYNTEDVDQYDEELYEEETMEVEPSFDVDQPSQDLREGAVQWVEPTEKGPKPAPASPAEVIDYRAIRESLAAQGLVVEAMADKAVHALYVEIQKGRSVIDAELALIAEKYPDVIVDFPYITVRPEDKRRQVTVVIPLRYPKEAPVIEKVSTNHLFQHELFLLSDVLHRDQNSLLVHLVAFISKLEPQPPTVSDEERRRNFTGLWKEVSGQDLDQHQSRTMFVQVTVEERIHVPTAVVEKKASGGKKKAGVEATGPVSRIAPMRFTVNKANPAVERAPPAAAVDAPRYGDRWEDKDNLMALMAHIKENDLRMLQFSHRALPQGVPRNISVLSTVTHLDFGSCGLTMLPPLGDMMLQKVFLSNNKFKEIPECLLSSNIANNLKILDLSFNELVELPKKFANFKKIEVLELAHNKLKRLCSFSGFTKTLEVLDVTDNNLPAVPPAIGDCDRLWRLKMSANPMYQVPPEVYYRGVDAVREFLRELSPASLTVPPSTFVADMVRLWTDHDSSKDVEVRCDLLEVERAAPGAFVLPYATTRIHLVSLAARAPTLAALALSIPSDENRVVEFPKTCKVETQERFVSFVRFMCTGEQDVVEDVDVFLELARCIDATALVAELEQIKSKEIYDVDASVAACYETAMPKPTAVTGAVDEDDVERQESQSVTDIAFCVGQGAEQKIFRCHRALLCCRNPYLHSMLGMGFAEANMDMIPIDDADPVVFDAFISFLYSDSHGKKMTPQNAVNLLFVTEQYQCARLQAMSESMVGYHVEVENAAQVMQIAYFLDLMRLKKACMYFVASNYAKVKVTEGWSQLEDTAKEELIQNMDKWGMVY